MLRALPALLLLAVLAPRVRAEEAPAREPVEVEGAAAVVTPPDLPGEAATTAPGQWQLTYTGKGRFHRMQVRVFPVRDLREPGPVLMQALDTLVRNNGFGAFGATARSTSEVYGRPVADAAIQVSIDGRVARGHARLLLATDTRWAFAWGLVTAPELSRGTLARIQRFTKSLEPRDPTFHTPRFRDAAALARTVHQSAREQPITGGHLRGVAALIEAGLGRRLPVAARTNLETMLLLDVQRGTPETRTGYRQSAEDVVRSMQLDPEAREARMQALGQRILDAIRARAKQAYAPAVGALRIWTEDGRAVADADDGPLTAGTVEAELELATFLLAVARDRPVEIPEPLRRGHRAALAEAWPTASPALRADRRAVRATWARLRHAWDTAKPEARNAFRFALVNRLGAALPEAVRNAAPLPAAGDLRGLKRWLAEHGTVFARPEAVATALTLSAEARAALIDVLGVDAAGYQFGW